MQLLGNLKYPVSSLEDTLETTRSLSRALGNELRDVRSIGVGAANGRAHDRDDVLEDLSALGLIRLEGEQVRATKLAHRLTDPPSPDAYVTALVQAHRRVPLFRTLLESAFNQGVATSKQDLFLVLMAATSADPEEIDEQLDDLWERYRAFLREIRRALTTNPGRKVRFAMDRAADDREQIRATTDDGSV